MIEKIKIRKFIPWILGIQSISMIFFFLFAVVQSQQAEKNLILAKKNEQKGLQCEKTNQRNQQEQKKIIDSLETKLKECDAK
jgi:hypothetical protein